MSEWQLTVGMEIHVELETETKMFCGCKNDPFHSAPNTNVCPVCYGLPGALPLLNKKAVELVVRLGQALKADVAEQSFWARKNYFYPDLPKGYQISQSTAPLMMGGVVVLDGQEHHLHHAHLEEDAGKLMHAEDKSHSLVNYNRAGVPLLEMVTEPDFHTAEAAKKFCQELQRIMRSLKVSTADMEKGQMRCEANISVAKAGQPLGVKVEVKNINSFRAVEKAIQYEFERQTKALENGETINPETRSWSESEGKTLVMRSKETSADYRYFPEPDLPNILIDVADSGETHVLPDEQRQKLAELGLPKETIQAVLDRDGFAMVMELSKTDAALAIEAGKLLLAIPEFGNLSLADQEQLIRLRQTAGWPKETVEQVIQKSIAQNLPVSEVAKEFTHSEDLGGVIQEVISANAAAVADYRNGKETVFQFLVGQVMAKTQGRANIQTVREELKKAL